MLSFNGKRITKPGAYSKVSTDGLIPVSLGSTKVLAIVGESDRGEPKKVLWFNNATEAKRVLQGGTLLKAAQLAWSPSNERPGADLIAVVRLNAATQASHTLKNSTETDAVTLTAKDWGAIPYKVKVAAVESDVVVTITDGTTTEVSPALASNELVVAWINANSSLVTAAVLDTGLIEATADLVAFDTAGTSPVASSDDWQDACDLLENHPINGIVPMSPDATVHAYFSQQATTASSEGKERRLFVGHSAGETVAQITARAVALGTQRACLVTPSVKRVVNGVVETLDSMYSAALVAGLWAGLEHQEPTTFKYINVLGVGTEYTSSEIVELLEGRVVVLEQVVGKGYRVVQGLTTYQGDDLIYRELSTCTLADAMSNELRGYLEDLFVGKPYKNNTIQSMINSTISKLNVYVKRGWLVGDEDNPAYRSVNVHKEGTAFYVDYEGSVSTPNNYMFITSHFKPAV